MYQILCDGYVLDDPRYDELTVSNPKCKLGTNTVGEASFSIYATHPYYGHLEKMKSVFEILQDGRRIFRGRMTDDTKDFNNVKIVDIEGVMAYLNDSIIRPFEFPNDLGVNGDYINSENRVEFFLNWLIEKHNEQVQPFQQFKLGKVTVTAPYNYVYRSSEEHLKTWEVLKTRLIESSLGGYLCIRYEDDGNYIDYLEDFVLTNTQKIKFGENLLDLSNETDASETYSAVIPLGKRKNEINASSTDKSRLTIETIPDEISISDDIVKSGDVLYSKSAVERFGFICAPPADTTWEDVSETTNLLNNGVDYLVKKAMMLMNTITIKAVDLHFSDEEIEAFRIYSYISFESKPHGQEGTYRLTQLDIDIHNPQNTVITLGDATLTLIDINSSNKKESVERIETSSKNSNAFAEEIKNQVDVSLKEVTEHMNTIIDSLDNEWIVLTLDDSFAAYDELEANKPMYKLSGNTVEVKGCVVPLAEFTSNTEKVVFASGIPVELCPSSIRSFICQGSGMNRWLLTVETDGTLTFSRYGVSECVAVPTTEGLSFNGTYMIEMIEQKGTDET